MTGATTTPTKGEAVTVTQADRSLAYNLHGTPLASWPEQIARHREEAVRESEKDSFNRGYLIAVANCMNLHGNDVIAKDTLIQLGVDRAYMETLDLTDYDLEPLRKLFDEVEPKSALLSKNKEGLEQEDGRPGASLGQPAGGPADLSPSSVSQSIGAHQAQDDGWIEWHGGECPVSRDAGVQVRMRDGATERVQIAAYWCANKFDRDYWVHDPSDLHNDIIAYRVVRP